MIKLKVREISVSYPKQRKKERTDQADEKEIKVAVSHSTWRMDRL